MARIFTVTAIAAAAMLAGSAQAAALTGVQVLNQFSEVILGNASSTTETIGRTWIGGNVTSGLYAMSTSSSNAMPASSYAGLTVQGNASNIQVGNLGIVTGGNVSNSVIKTGTGGNSYVGGNSTNTNYDDVAWINGSLSGNLNKGGHAGSLADSGSHINGTKLTQTTALMETNKAAASSTDFASVLGGLSTSLSKLKGNSAVSFNSQGVVFNAAPVNGVAVFDLTKLSTDGVHQLDDLVFAAGSIKFNLNGATSVIINSDNSNIHLAANFDSAAALGSKLVWNMYGASSVNIERQFGGSVLATGASFTNGNSIEGGVYANSINQRGEIHLVSFGGALPVPEPETYAMMLGGLGLVGLMVRRR
jgi:choice-of-anchor A domain-containing protein